MTLLIVRDARIPAGLARRALFTTLCIDLLAHNIPMRCNNAILTFLLDRIRAFAWIHRAMLAVVLHSIREFIGPLEDDALHQQW